MDDRRPRFFPVRFQWHDLLDLLLKVDPLVAAEIGNPDRYMKFQGTAHTFVNAEGDPVACVGIWDNNVAWAFLSTEAKSKPLSVHRAVKHWLNHMDRTNARAIYTAVHRKYARGQKWAHALGFEPVGATETHVTYRRGVHTDG